MIRVFLRIFVDVYLFINVIKPHVSLFALHYFDPDFTSKPVSILVQRDVKVYALVSHCISVPVAQKP
jgi:hypothetical protein